MANVRHPTSKLIHPLPQLCLVILSAGWTLGAGKTGPGQVTGAQGAPPTEHLGTVSFPVSCTPTAQKRFAEAVAWLHSFEFDQSEAAFRDAARQDPTCAMAWWGVAMTKWHPLWEHPDADALKKGTGALQHAEALHPKTHREQAYIAALGKFYKDCGNPDYQARAEAYSEAMGQLYRQYPTDREAGAFYALSLLASEPTPDPGLSHRREALAILNQLFREEPNHPGVAHYIIHTCDVPALAPDGLRAARAYARIAPASPHALHMPSHIFTRLGLWQDSIDSNIASAAAAEKPELLHLNGPSHALHAFNFRQYAYLQMGHNADARQMEEDAKAVPGASAEQIRFETTTFQTRYALETHAWKMAAGLKPLPDSDPGLQAMVYWVRTIGAARSEDAAGARRDLDHLDALRKTMLADKSEYGSHPYEKERQEAAAWTAEAEGRKDEAVRIMLEAAEHEEAEGGPDTLSTPVQEMLGDLLMEAQRPAEALKAYQAALKEAPNRFDSLYGAAQAADRAGKPMLAREYYASLLAVRGSGADRPELAKAQISLARK